MVFLRSRAPIGGEAYSRAASDAREAGMSGRGRTVGPAPSTVAEESGGEGNTVVRNRGRSRRCDSRAGPLLRWLSRNACKHHRDTSSASDDLPVRQTPDSSPYEA